MGLLIICPLYDERPEVASKAHAKKFHKGHSKNSKSDILGVRVHEIIDGGVAALLEGVLVSAGSGVLATARFRRSSVVVLLPVRGVVDTTTLQYALKGIDSVYADMFCLVAVLSHTILELIFDRLSDRVLVGVDSDSKSDLSDEDNSNETEVEKKHASVLGEGATAPQQSHYEDDAAQ